ncbi:MAG TPA: SGNH/GDSL hydrolase family protein [Chloroflexota bacterium]|nr:SGNH/GDSL hydrolase family protein [Chloroflexota bacterium]
MAPWGWLGLAVLAVVASACGPPNLAVAPPARPLVYVALGASDAVGVGASDPVHEGWVPVLHSYLPAGTRLVNLGVSGSLLRDALVQQLPVAIDAAPDLVTVWLAVNDFNARVPLEEYSAQLDQLLGRLRGETSAQVVIANLPDLSRVPVYAAVPPELLRAEIGRWNAAIERAARRHGAVLVDLYPLGPELASQPEYVGLDGFHPSAAGYRRLAEVMWAAITANHLLP